MSSLGVEGVVFDFDATLVNLGDFVDWREGHRRAVEIYLACGCVEETVESCGSGGLFNMLNLMWDELCSSLPRIEAERVQGMVYDAIGECEAQGVFQCHLMPGCVEVLNWIRERGVKMGVATSNSQRVAEEVLSSRGLLGFFTAVVGRTPMLRMKPYPDQILLCFEKMGVNPARGVVVGDSIRDVLAAKAAGAYAIAVPARFTRLEALEKSEPANIIMSLEELPDALSALRI